MENPQVEAVEMDTNFQTEVLASVDGLNQNGFEIALGLLSEVFFDLALVAGEEAVAAMKKELFEQYAGQEEVCEKSLVARAIYNSCALCEEFYGWDNPSDLDG